MEGLFGKKVVMVSKCGVYAITNKNQPTKFYIGSAKNISARWTGHKSKLRTNCHENSILQRTWNKHGEGVFDFQIIQLCDASVRFVLEQSFIDRFQPLYNICKIAGSPPPPDPKKSRAVMARLRAEGKLGNDKKPVIRTTSGTDEEEYYDSLKEAGEKNNISPACVGKCCRGEMNTYKGYYWKFADGSSPEFTPAPGTKKPIIQYDLESGKTIAEHESENAAARAGESFHLSAIHHCCNGKRGSYAGYGWKYADESSPVFEYNTLEGKAIISYSLETGDDIKHYAMIIDAEQDGFNQGHISDCCNGKRNSHGGVGWRFADQPVPAELPKLREIKPIEMIELVTGKVVKEYGNSNQAEADGHNGSLIRMCLYRQRISHAGYGWRYKGEDYIPRQSGRVKTSKVECVKDGQLVKTYEYVALVKHDGFSPSKVSECCKGKRKTHKGYKWRYLA